MKPIYLDNAASTMVKDNVLEKFIDVTKIYGNPSSMHKIGVDAQSEIYDARDIISEKIVCKPDEIYFTSGATMSNQLLIQGFIKKHPDCIVVTTNVEHNDIMMLMENTLCYKHILRVNKDGLINLDGLRKVLEYAEQDMNVPVLVSIQMANSETGIIQPIREIGKIVKEFSNAFLHMDATQYIPYFPINMECWGIDSISMSGQKIGGIKGSGLLVVRQTLKNHVSPIIYGEQGLIGGTPSVPLIASLGEAFKSLKYNPISIQDKRDKFLACLEDMGGILVGNKEHRLPNNIYIRFPTINGMLLLWMLNDNNIYIGTGSACSSDSDKPSHVALAYGLTEDEAFECVRFTLSNETTYNELNYVIEVLEDLFYLNTNKEGKL